MKFYYLANMRLPTEKAHGLQIMQMCEAFACAGNELTLLVPRRINTPEMSSIADPWAYYGVSRNFAIWPIPCIDLFPWLRRAERAALAISTLSYLVLLVLALLFRRADIYYSRDAVTVLALSLFKPRQTLIYEAHQFARSGLGRLLQGGCVRRAGLVVAVTGKLGDDLRARGAQCIVVAHDGFRLERFANLPDRQAARSRLNLPEQAFIVGYAGQLHTMSMSKGIDVVIEAIARLPDRQISLCLVGGPAEAADSLRAHWLGLGLSAARFLFLGRVEPPAVPVCLSAFDVCAMPFPWTEHFAYYASPLKLFEYMAAGRATISSDLPAVAEVVRDGETALLFPPGDVGALAAALSRLYDDSDLRDRIGGAARRAAMDYSWQARAERILATMTD
jgi:glycosyltransferase involved in cell wall biosynthesis